MVVLHIILELTDVLTRRRNKLCLLHLPRSPSSKRFFKISFSSLIAVAKTSKTMLNSSGESGMFVLFLTLWEMLSIFHH